MWLSRDLITNSHLVEKFLEPFGIFVDAKTFAAAAGFNPANRKQGNKTTNGADFCNTSHSTWVPNPIWLDLFDNFPFQGESLSLYVVLRYVSHITVTLEREINAHLCCLKTFSKHAVLTERHGKGSFLGIAVYNISWCSGPFHLGFCDSTHEQ